MFSTTIDSIAQLEDFFRERILTPALWRLGINSPLFEGIKNSNSFQAKVALLNTGSWRWLEMDVAASRFVFPDCGGLNKRNYMVIMQRSGTSRISCGKQMMTLMPGSWGLIMQPSQLTIENSNFAAHTMILPNRALSASLEDFKSPGLYQASHSPLLAKMMYRCVCELSSDKSNLEQDASAIKVIGQTICNVASEIFKNGWIDARKSNEVRLIKEPIVQYMKLHLNNPELTVAWVAEAFDCSTRTIHRQFSKTGKSFEAELTEMRINTAIEILGSTPVEKASITEIAMDCGFSSASAFSTSFKKITGLAPSHFFKEKSHNFTHLSSASPVQSA